MSKLKEMIHQYVVEALQELLDEEHNPELDKLVDKYSDQILKARGDSHYPEAHEDEALYILKQIKTQHGHEAVRYARAHAQKNLDDVNRKENEQSKADAKANYKPTSGPAFKQYKESVNQISELSLNTLKSYRDKVYDKYTPDGYGTPTSERPKPKFTRSQGYGRAETNIENKTPLEYEPKVHDLTHFEDDGDVYDHTQTSDEIRDGDVMKLSGGRVATMYRAFPVMHKGESNALHRTHEGKTIGDIGTRYKETEKLANKVANMKEEGLRRQDRIGKSLANAALKGGNDPTNIRKRYALRGALDTAVAKGVRRSVAGMRKRLFRTPESDPHN